MAARLNKAHQDDVRLKIKTSQLVNRLQDYALEASDAKTGETVEIDAGRLKAIEILLRKSLPDLSSVTMQGDADGGPVLIKDVTAAEILEAKLNEIASRAAGTAT
jgi:hypothetical protein